jgi:hypothetical protein
MPSDTQELNKSMSSEEIAAYAESVVEEVRAERNGDKKSDAEIVNETSAPSKTIAEEVSSSSTEAESQSEGSGSESSDPEWVDDDVKAEAAAYGLDESDLSEFTSREELDRALRLFDKKALDAGRKAMAESEETRTRNEKGQFVKKESDENETGESKAAKQNSNRYEIGLSKDEYDDKLVDVLSGLNDHLDSRLSMIEAFIAEERSRAEENRFDSLVDSLGHPDLFGKTGHESPQELERRKDLLVAVKAQMIGLERLGRPSDMDDKLISRVANMVFPAELGKKRLKQHTQKISRQANLRQGGSPTKPLPPSDNPRDEFDRLYKELERA